jgi:DNA-binding transcriptional MerR regulator
VSERARPAVESVDAVLGIGRYARPPARTEADGPLLSIGVFARRSRLSLKALRLYDRLGVLVPADVDQDTGYRRYRESQLLTARLVATLRRLDMPLAQVGEVVSTSGPRGAEVIAGYWDAVERRVASQRELATHLRNRLLGDERSFAMFEVRERDVLEQVVIAEQRHVLVPALADWIRAATGRLLRAAEPCGGRVAPPFVVYHGEVNQDSDGPVEVCLPVLAAQAVSAPVAWRVEPAHREAYVRLRKAQVENPQILSAFDAVGQWIADHGRVETGPPREVYFASFDSAGPDHEVCDVAFPIRGPR